MSNVNLSKTDYNSLVSALNMYDVKSDAQITSTQGANNTANVTVTLNGKSETFSVTYVPTLEGSENVDNAKELEEVAAKLDAIVASLKGESTTVQTSTTARPSAFLDIYELMAILQEVANQQRKTANEMRMASHQSAAANLQSQASTLKTAANETFTQNMISAGISALGVAVSAGMAGLSIGMQVSAAKAAGVGDAAAGANAAKSELNTVKSDLNGTSTNSLSETQLKSLGFTQAEIDSGKITPEMKMDAINKTFGEGTISPETKSAAAEYTSAKQDISVKEAAVNEQKAVVEGAGKDLKAKSDAFKAADEKLGGLKPGDEGYDAAKTQYDTAKSELKTANETFTKESAELKTREGALQDSKIVAGEKAAAYNKSLGADIDKAVTDPATDAKFKELNDKMVKQAEAGDVDGAAKTRGEINTILEKRDTLNAFKSEEQGRMGSTLLDGAQAKYDQMSGKFEHSLQVANQTQQQKWADQFQNMSRISDQLFRTGAQVADSFAQRTDKLAQANVKTLEAENEMILANKETASELRDEAQQLFVTTNNLLKAVIEAEGAAVRSAIRA